MHHAAARLGGVGDEPDPHPARAGGRAGRRRRSWAARRTPARAQRRLLAARAPGGRPRCRGRSRPRRAAGGRPGPRRTTGASTPAGSGWLAYPSTTSISSTPTSGSAASIARRSARAAGSIIGCGPPAGELLLAEVEAGVAGGRALEAAWRAPAGRWSAPSRAARPGSRPPRCRACRPRRGRAPRRRHPVRPAGRPGASASPPARRAAAKRGLLERRGEVDALRPAPRRRPPCRRRPACRRRPGRRSTRSATSGEGGLETQRITSGVRRRRRGARWRRAR